MKLNELTLKATVEGIKKGEFKALDVAKATLDEIDAKEGEMGAYLSVNKEDVLASAQAVDDAVAAGGKLGNLAGASIALKDAILYKGYPTTAGSKILKEYIASYDSTVSRKLREAGAVIIGKTNMDEFAMGSSTENSGFKLTRNPRDLERVPGGSSGGSAAAVAADMASAALGSDTGGSIRQPAAFCGIVGLKTTYGAVSRYGLIAMASSLDQIGPMTKTVEDAAIVFKAIAGKDQLDSTSNAKAQYGDDILSPDLGSLKKLKIGIPKEYFEGGLDDDVEKSLQETISWFKKEGFSVEEVSLPNTKYALSVYYVLMPAEASTNLARFDGIRYGTRHEAKDLEELYLKDRGEGFGAEVKRRITLGTFVLSAGYYEAYYGKAQKVRALIKKDFDEAFKKVDVLLTPTTPTVPFKFGEKSQSPLQMYLSDIFTIPANLAGIPALNIPVKGREGKLPVGFQLMG
ncbi:MAG: Asp-tRNA(Asn)/Glu-tRNA(Gln) amidotransferase subunit GatA, partial [Candidatus Colwellbacteria bacterium]|nr:Asp-tRNA(Asn)/Glu-tRNA(Gln) amidotransferase subunit GatA [Candidatus Colwellbacteria bacterium]